MLKECEYYYGTECTGGGECENCELRYKLEIAELFDKYESFGGYANSWNTYALERILLHI